MRDSYLLWSSGGFNSFTPHQSVFRQMDAILYVCVPAMFLFPLTTQPHRHFHWNVMRSRLNISLYIGPCSPFTHDPSQETFPNIYEWTAWLKVAIDCIYSYPYPQQTTATRDQMWFFKFFAAHICAWCSAFTPRRRRSIKFQLQKQNTQCHMLPCMSSSSLSLEMPVFWWIWACASSEWLFMLSSWRSLIILYPIC